MGIKAWKRKRGRITAAAMCTAVLTLPQGAAHAATASATPVLRTYLDSNWGGYVAQGSFTGISGSWTEPHVTCGSANDLFAPWVGLDGFGSNTAEQTGVQTDCSTGVPVLSAFYEMYPGPPMYWSDPVQEGDSITASVVFNGGDSYALTLTDTTQGWTERVNKSIAGRNASAEAVIESPSQSYPSFSRLTFTGVTVDGQPFSNAKPLPLSSGGYTPGPLSSGSFSLTRSP
ncbi:G1 family glutamic endopeptidase [Streptomyces sp. NPDC001262]|uniref:G1 family glutamic endopeptidase n=1 Tax=Streptomyces sp. NPDC001262 TaxID=3364552 RepID=UPI0036798416